MPRQLRRPGRGRRQHGRPGGQDRSWCHANDADLAGVFVDAGLSGGRADNRPGLHDALKAVCDRRDRGKGNVLVVYSLSRMARSTRDTLLIAERLQKAGADLVSLSEKIDTTCTAGKMVFRMLAVFAEFERNLASERTRMAAAYKRGRGEAWAHAPFGQRKDEAGLLADDPAEMATVAAVVALRAGGLTIRAIVAEMNARGVTTRDSGRFPSPPSSGSSRAAAGAGPAGPGGGVVPSRRGRRGLTTPGGEGRRARPRGDVCPRWAQPPGVSTERGSRGALSRPAALGPTPARPGTRDVVTAPIRTRTPIQERPSRCGWPACRRAARNTAQGRRN